jgi:hypothetical protein
MNASSKKISDLEDQATSVLDVFPQKINKLNSLESKLGSKFLSKFTKEYSSYREFSCQDPNCLFKILMLGSIEFLLTMCDNSSNFEEGLRNFGTVNYMVLCQGGCKNQLAEEAIASVQRDLSQSLYNIKASSHDIGDTIQHLYNILAADPKVSRVVTLMGRGQVYEFLNKDSEELETIKNRSQLDIKTFISTICSYMEDFNFRNKTLLDVLCAMTGRNLIIHYADSHQETKYPSTLKINSPFSETIIFHADMIYWLRGTLSSFQTDSTTATQHSEEEYKADIPTSDTLSVKSSSSPNGKHSDRSYMPKKMKLSTLPRHLGDEGTNEDIYSTDENCKNCISILNRCIRIKAMYCESCRVYFCDDCKMSFNEARTCKCRRCVCCFMEYCLPGLTIGETCQTFCHQCHEQNDPATSNIVRYECGHGYCRMCMFQNVCNWGHEPRYCFLCRLHR